MRTRPKGSVAQTFVLLLVFFIALIMFLIAIRRFFNIFLPEEFESIIKVSSGFIISIIFFRSLGNSIKKSKIPKANQLSQQIKLIGYIISLLILVSFFKELTTAILTIGAISGIVLGITLQPVLGNFFAGVLITFTRYIEVGKKVRILSSSIPFVTSTFPAYKFLSVEDVDTGYKGEIIEIDWFFSTLKTEQGRLLKIPNLVLLNSAVLDYDIKENPTYSLRVEFPLKMKRGWNLDKVEKEINRILKSYNVVQGPYFNEQSDKNYVYIRMKIESKKSDWESEKSELLKELLKLKERVEKQ